ncbi:MAG: hypothetical protein LUE86_06910 [Clostridiales bacterium]|nr:hypothetical protein [Clostridiales bacterium]
MRRIPCVDWFDTTRGEYPETEGEYLVAIPDEDEEYTMQVASWKHKGSTVFLDRDKDDTDPSTLTKEEQLIRAIFGNVLRVEIEQNGFYIITADYGRTAEHPDCTNGIFPCGECFWCELPAAPKSGLNQQERRIRAEMQRNAAQRLKAEGDFEDAMAFAKKNGYAKRLMEIMKIADQTDPFADMSVETQKGGAYRLKAWELACLICDAVKMVSAYPNIDPGKLRSGIQNTAPQDLSLTNLMNDAFQENPVRFRKYLAYLVCAVLGQTQFSRNTEYARCHDKATAILTSSSKQSAAWKISSIAKFMEIPAPDIILVNELRILVHALIGIDKTWFAGYTENFAKTFHVNPDGSAYTAPAEEEPDDVVECVELPEDEDEEEVIGIDYPYLAVVETPNELFWQGLYCLFDNEKNECFVDPDDGKVKTFGSIPEAFAYKKQMDQRAGRATS